MSQKFRADINGLRAIAVIAVVLFHFNPSWMPGGFAGVDVFFVISGFLMTGIIFRGLEQNNFSILKFYVARANRIIPALALLCIVLLVVGWFYLTPMEYKALGKHAASSVTFLSNIIYWREVGYFDAGAHEKWLLHTWSLSVEWQFYIIYPIILVLLAKMFSIKTIKSILVVSTILGFIFCVIATYKWPNPSYYLLSTRAWEMMLGGIAYLYPLTVKESRKKVFELAGLVLIIGSYFLISADNPWPGYLAILPVLGSFLLIQAQRNNSFITGNAVSQKIGSWSYSIYLWHWPLVVAIYIFSLSEFYTYAGIILSIFLGFLSHKYIEKIKFRNQFSNIFSYLKCKPIYLAGFVGLLGVFVFIKYESLTPFRLSAERITIVEQEKRDPRASFCGRPVDGISPQCTYGNGPVKAIIIGDSHSQSQNVSIGDRASLHGGSVVSFAVSGCPTIKDVYSVNHQTKEKNYNCGVLVAKTINIVKEKYPGVPIIIINRLSQSIHGYNEKNNPSVEPILFIDHVFSERNTAYHNNLKGHMISTICNFSENNPVYLVRPTPELKDNVPLTMFRSSITLSTPESVKITRKEFSDRQKIAYEMQNEAAQKCGVKILDPTPYLCDQNYCYGDINKIPLYLDDDHLSAYGAKLISPIYDQVFK
ncbi:acyltransferase family protein [Acinetobacter sp. YH01006]|uniref:acyltransferase family protein n=1 Tax=Acinetobacter sp. YH01006 TaxID=2601022 RepID=UPI0015D268EF|nr:acyltransferase family protein [Acinetobacter sp. YH01006]